ncbi:hypothetical protein BC828DRAFT_374154 [Blastocladiella britannica]|nr:hypothetical protein BC828DRAFT_374154 [Blastocladiella britannica]
MLKNATDPSRPEISFTGRTLVTATGAMYGVLTGGTHLDSLAVMGSLPPGIDRSSYVPKLRAEIEEYRSTVAKWISGESPIPGAEPVDKVSNCTWFVYAQMRQTHLNASDTIAAEDEATHSTGSWVASLPRLDSHWVLDSRDCNVTLTSAPGAMIQGTSYPVLNQRAEHLAIVFLALVLVKGWVSVRYAESLVVLSDLVKTSKAALAGMIMVDCYFGIMLALLALVNTSQVLIYLAATFLEWLHILIYGWRVLSKVMRAHNSPLSEIRIRFPHFMLGYVVIFALNFGLLVLYDQGSARALVFGLVATLYTYPLLQSIRSARLDAAPHINSQLWLATGYLLRLFFPSYLFQCPANLFTFGVVGDGYEQYMLGLQVWAAVQLLVLGSQRILGAGWYLPRRWKVVRYQYRVTADELGAHLAHRESVGGGSGSGAGGEGEHRNGEADCAICMGALVEEVEGSEEERMARAARHVVRTPCAHWFHAECLEGWLEHRLQCPTCRANVPELVRG